MSTTLVNRKAKQLRSYALEHDSSALKKRRLENVAPAVAGPSDEDASGPSAATSQNTAAWKPHATLRQHLITSGQLKMKRLTVKSIGLVHDYIAQILASPTPVRKAAVLPLDFTTEAPSAVVLALTDVLLSGSGAKAVAVFSATQPSAEQVQAELTKLATVSSTTFAQWSSHVDGEMLGNPVRDPSDCVSGSLHAAASANAKSLTGLSLCILIGGDKDKTQLTKLAASLPAQCSLLYLSNNVDNASAKLASLPSLVANNATTRPIVEVNTFTAEGTPRFETLNRLLCHSGGSERIVVHVATPQEALFFTDALYALQCPHLIICDAECDSTEIADQKLLEKEEGGAAGPRVAPAANSRKLNALDRLAEFESETKKAGSGGIFFSAYGLVPNTASVFVQFGPIVNDAAFLQLFSMPAIAQCKQRYCFFAPSEATKVPKWLRQQQELLTLPVIIRTKPLALPSQAGKSANAMLFTMDVAEAVKKTYALQLKAYEAYKAFCLCYSLLKPSHIYNVYDLNLEKVAAQFGLEKAPMLDLRTKSTQFRPKEDVFRAAMQRRSKDIRTMKQISKAEGLLIEHEEDPDWVQPPSEEDE